MIKNTFLLIFFFASLTGYSQDKSSVFIGDILDGKYYNYGKIHTENLLDDYKDFDFSNLWLTTESSYTLGFIGDNYQRFQIKFISIIKDLAENQTYRIFGKSKVNQNICDFQGAINIKSIHHIDHSEYPDIVCGLLIFDYEFFEDPKQKHVGVFNGKGVVYWYKDPENNIVYDDLMQGADGFRNNQFVGIWTKYGNSNSKTCNWGDYRIPLSGDLDHGAGEFGPSEKYKDYGWENLLDAYFYGDDKKREKALKIEQQEWWK